MKYCKTERDPTYLFTVEKGPITEDFFKSICKIARETFGISLIRWGRCRDRKSKGIDRKYGHVKLADADRWDLYIKLPFEDRLDDSYWPQLKVRALLHALGKEIIANNWYIEYANPLYTKTFDNIFNTRPITPAPTMKTQKYTVKLTAQIDVPYIGSTAVVVDVENHLKSLGFDECDVEEVLPVDEYKDLPLVTFEYNAILRKVRVVSMDSKYLNGYEDNQYKTFRLDMMDSEIVLAALPAKNQ